MRKFCLILLPVIAMESAIAQADVVYNSIPSPAPTSLPSLGYQASHTSEFGDAVGLAGTARVLTSATVMLSNWALESTYETVGTSPGYVEPMTFSLYNFGSSGSNPTVGTLIASATINALIPWRPEASGTCTGGKFQAPDGCFSGLGVPVTFDFNGVTLPDNVIFGLSFNTQTFGASPYGVPGPYDSLNFGVSGGATVGTDINPDGVEINSNSPATVNTGALNVFGPDTGWTPFVPAVTLDAIPEPASLGMLLSGVIGMVVARRRRR